MTRKCFLQCFFILLFALSAKEAVCRNYENKLDSLNSELKKAQHDSLRVKLYLGIIEETYRQNPDSVIVLSEQLIEIVERALKTADKDQQHYLLAVKANCFNNIGAIQNQRGDVKKALANFHESLKLKEKLGEDKAVSSTLNNIGYLYESIGDRDNALLYYKRSLEIKERIDDKKGIARLLNNIGSIYDDLNDTSKALPSYRKSYRMSELQGDHSGMATALNNIGFSFDKAGNTKEAFEYYEKALELRLAINEKRGIAESLNNLGNIYMKDGNEAKALGFASKALGISQELGYPEYIKRSSHLLKEIYLKQKKYSQAYEMYDLYITMRDSIVNDENRNEALKKSFEYEYEKKTAADSIKNHELQKIGQIRHDNEISRQRWYAYGGLIGFVLMLIISLISFYAYRQKQRTNRLIREKQKEIIDSITYARRIQKSLLPTEKYINNSMKRLNRNIK